MLKRDLASSRVGQGKPAIVCTKCSKLRQSKHIFSTSCWYYVHEEGLIHALLISFIMQANLIHPKALGS